MVANKHPSPQGLTRGARHGQRSAGDAAPTAPSAPAPKAACERPAEQPSRRGGAPIRGAVVSSCAYTPATSWRPQEGRAGRRHSPKSSSSRCAWRVSAAGPNLVRAGRDACPGLTRVFLLRRADQIRRIDSTVKSCCVGRYQTVPRRRRRDNPVRLAADRPPRPRSPGRRSSRLRACR